MKHLDDAAIDIGQLLDLHDFPKNPSALGVIAVNQHIFSYLLLLDGGLVVEVVMDELTHVCL